MSLLGNRWRNHGDKVGRNRLEALFWWDLVLFSDGKQRGVVANNESRVKGLAQAKQQSNLLVTTLSTAWKVTVSRWS